MNPQEFALTRLGLKYSTFSYRVRVGHLTIQDYHRILFFTGKTFESLFPSPYGTQEAPSLLPPSPPTPQQLHTSVPLNGSVGAIANGVPRAEPVEMKREAEAPLDFKPIATGIPSIDRPEDDLL